MSLFKRRLGPAAAAEEFRRQLEADPEFHTSWLTDSRKMPQANTIQYWYGQHIAHTFSADTVEELIAVPYPMVRLTFGL